MLHPDQKPLRLASVKGMNDILPEQAALWAHFEDAAQTTLRAYGYQRIRTPIVEHTSLFARSIGAATDIVEKEVYCFTDALNGEQLSLRPENTAAIVRAAIEHHLLYDGPKRLWYCLQLQGLRLELNTLGQLDERAAHRAALADYLKRHIELLDEDAKRRLE